MEKAEDGKELLTLTDRFMVAEQTMAFRFNRPENLTFRPGDWIKIQLIDPPETDAEGNMRKFSICNAPYEDFLLVTTRLRDTAFKRVLRDLPIGSKVKLDSNGGNFSLHNNLKRAAIFLIGGIGITPIRSILRNEAHEHLEHKIQLFYSNRHPKDAPYLDELKELREKLPNYQLIATMTADTGIPDDWSGERGRITFEMLSKFNGELPDPIYYIVGPPKMVTGIHQMLNQNGIDDDDIRTEDFNGY